MATTAQNLNAILLKSTTDIVSALLSNTKIDTADLPSLISTVHATLSALDQNSSLQSNTQTPAIAIADSITDEFIICLEDGKKLKMLKRYLRSQYDMSPEEYRAKWNLPHDYPLVAPNYAAKRSAYAKEFGLGKKKAG